MQVGREVRLRRNELQMSLREVAELTELSTGFLSQVENDQVSPSLASLGRIAEAADTAVRAAQFRRSQPGGAFRRSPQGDIGR
ncbi:MAG: helix-turn-helix transcriptional regulator [Acidimicrobiales bacterium]